MLDWFSLMQDRSDIMADPYRMQQLVGYVPQTESVDWDFPVTVLDVVLMGHFGRLKWLGRPGRKHREEALHALETVDGLSEPAFKTAFWWTTTKGFSCSSTLPKGGNSLS